MNTINTLSRFVISAFLLLLTTQAFATLNPNPATQKLYWDKSGTNGELKWTSYLNDKSFEIKNNRGTTIDNISTIITSCIVIFNTSETYKEGSEFVTKWSECGADTANFPAKAGATVTASFGGTRLATDYTLCLLDPDQPGKADCGSGYKSLSLSIASDATITANEGANKTHTLVASDNTATFSILEDTSGLFNLNNNTLTFNGSTTDFETTPNTYTVKVKASTGTGDDNNAEQVITLTLTDVNDETPTDISLSRSDINEGAGSANSAIGILTTTDADANNTFSYTSNNADFTITSTGSLVNKFAQDYETAQTQTLTITVDDGAGNTFNKEFTITINDIDDTAPTNIALSNNNIVIGAAANTTIGTLSADDVDTTTALTYSVDDTTNFIIAGNKLQIKQVTTAAATHNIKITASDGTNTSTEQDFTINVISNPNPADITNPNNISRAEGTSKTAFTITATDIGNTALTYGISGTDAGQFDINGAVVSFKTAPDFDAPTDNGNNNVYDLILEVNDTLSTTTQPIAITNLNEQTLTVNNQTLSVDEDAAVDAVVGTITTTGSPTAFSITAGNTDGFFKINPTTGQIQVAATGLDYETTKTYTLAVEITGTDADAKTANITITLNNLADILAEQTPTVNAGNNITTSINKTVTLSATGNDPDGDNATLTYAWTQTAGDSVTLTNANTKTATFATTSAMEGKDFTFSVTASDGTYTSAADSVTVKVNNNAEVIATAVRKESKVAAKVLLARVSKTVMGRLSHLRRQKNQKSGFTANGFVNGIKVSFTDNNLGTAFNQVLNANGMSSTIPTPNHKINRWDTWTSAKIIIGESNGTGTNKTEFNLKSINVGLDRRIDKTKTIGFALGLGKEDRTATGTDFTGDVDTTQYTLSSYGALELNQHTAIEAVLGIAKGTHKVNSTTTSDNQNSSGYFASVAYRGNMQKGKLGLSPYARYDISRIKMKATDALTNSETTTDEALAIGVDINHTSDYEDGNLTRFANLEYKSDIRREGTTYISQNAEQEISLKLGITYQKGDTNTTINYQRTQSTNNKAHSNGIEGTLRWKF